MLKYFESHAHYMDEKFDGDRDELLKELYEKDDVSHIINIGYDMPSSYKAVEIAEKYPYCYAAIGVHPHDAKNIVDGDYDRLKKLSENKKVVAIGEIGLDYYYDNSERDIQIQAFIDQMAIAKEIKKPIVIHEREATKDALDIILARENVGVFHCFSGSKETAKIVLDKGYYISFSGTVTFKNAKKVKEVAEYVPLDRFLIETDCPYLAPEPVRGTRNYSYNLRYTAKEIARLKGLTLEEIAEKSLNNAKTLFGIKD